MTAVMHEAADRLCLVMKADGSAPVTVVRFAPDRIAEVQAAVERLGRVLGPRMRWWITAETGWTYLGDALPRPLDDVLLSCGGMGEPQIYQGYLVAPVPEGGQPTFVLTCSDYDVLEHVYAWRHLPAPASLPIPAGSTPCTAPA